MEKLSSPIYPPLARTAHIFGDVEVRVGVRQDGSIESVVATGGHPLLKQAALVSVQSSEFRCKSCTDVVTSQTLVYTFELGPPEGCTQTAVVQRSDHLEETYPQVSQSNNHITVIERAWATCDFGPTIVRKIRSVKCLYLWRCVQEKQAAQAGDGLP